jgi:FMN-dependent NADH-azoreductase
VKALLVTYMPRMDRSHTKKLVDCFRQHFQGALTELDLLKNQPDYFLEDNLDAYIHKHYLGEKLSPQQEKALAPMSQMAKQFKEHDLIVMAFPMFNFSLPGIVKSYLDSVMLKGETWDLGPSGYQGLLKGKKAFLFSSSGGSYEGARSSWDHCLPVAETCMRFMGINEVEKLSMAGVNMPDVNLEKIGQAACQKITQVLKKWDVFRN